MKSSYPNIEVIKLFCIIIMTIINYITIIMKSSYSNIEVIKLFCIIIMTIINYYYNNYEVIIS